MPSALCQSVTGATPTSKSTTETARFVQRHLDDAEPTLDMLCDDSRQPLAVVPSERAVIGMCLRVRAQFAGPVTIQCRVGSGRPVVVEINRGRREALF